MKRNNNYGLTLVVGTVAAIITIMSLAVTIFVLLDRKRKKEDKELEEYLESTIQ